MHGEKALERLIHINAGPLYQDPRVVRALVLLAQRCASQKNAVPRFLNTVLGFELGVQQAVMQAFFQLWAEETARAKLDGSYAQGGILNLKGERVEVEGAPQCYINQTPAQAAAAVAAAAAAAVAKGGGADAVKEEQKKQRLTVVSLTLDRGLSFDHALQMLLLANQGADGQAGRSGFYLPSDQGPVQRPLLALQRASSGFGGGGEGEDEKPPPPVFKVLWPDIGREAYMDRTQEELLAMRFLTAQEAEPLWAQRYESALTTCAPHGSARCRCGEGKRLRTCHILTFNLTQHWKLVQKEILKRKRLRVLRAETTSGACGNAALASCLLNGLNESRSDPVGPWNDPPLPKRMAHPQRPASASSA